MVTGSSGEAGQGQQQSSFIGEVEILIRGQAFRLGAVAGAGPSRTLEAESMRWSYVLRARERWLGKDDAIESHEREATEPLLSLPLEEDDLAQIARADRVVVRMPYRSQEEGWAASVMPWEYLISAATRRHRRASGNSFTVMRAGWVDPRSGCRLTRAFRVGGLTGGLSALAAGNHLGTSDIEYGTHSSRRAVQRAARACSLDSLRRAADAAASIMCERLTKKEAVLSLFRRPPK